MDATREDIKVMRSRDDGKKLPCVHCGQPTVFERIFLGKRGGQHREICCGGCGPERDAENTASFGAAA